MNQPGIISFNMNAYTKMTEGDVPMNSNKPMESQNLESQEQSPSQPVEWIVDDVVVNGKTLTILFPEIE